MDHIGYYLSLLHNSVEVEFIIKILICIVAGYIIGQERAARGKNAGITTFTFVIIGAMLFTFLSENIDPASTSRIAAQIVSGIWFLWAGLIFINDNKVKNLTTAAWVWLAGAIGMAIGFDYYAIALITTIFARLIPQTNDKISQRRRSRNNSHDTDQESSDDDDLQEE